MKFTIRDVLWLTALVALGAAWWIDRSRLTELIRTLKDQHAAARMAALRAQELRGEIILQTVPDSQLRNR